MSFLSWILFGLIVGYLAHLADARNIPGGIMSSLILGIVGSVVGGFLGNLIFGIGISGFNISSFLIAIAGAFLVVVAQRSLMKRA